MEQMCSVSKKELLNDPSKFKLLSLNDAVSMKKAFVRIMMKRKNEQNWEKCWLLLSAVYEKEKKKNRLLANVIYLLLVPDLVELAPDVKLQIPKEAGKSFKEVGEFFGITKV